MTDMIDAERALAWHEPHPRPCPPWCDIPDHADAGGPGYHAADGQTIDLHHYPFVIPGRDDVFFETMTVSLEIDTDDLQPHVMFSPRDDGAYFRMTVLEAEQLAAAPLAETGKWRGSIESVADAFR